MDSNKINAIRDSLKRQIYDASVAIFLTSRLIEKSNTKIYSTEVPGIYLESLKEVNECLAGFLTEYQKILDDDPNNSNINVLLDIGNDIWNLEDAAIKLRPKVRFADGADIENVPWSLLKQFEQLCCMIDPSLKVIVRARWTYTHDLNRVNRQIEKVLEEVKVSQKLIEDLPNFLMLTFPKSEKNNYLAHGIWAHELAHYIDEFWAEEFLSEELLERYNDIFHTPVILFSNHLAIGIEDLILKESEKTINDEKKMSKEAWEKEYGIEIEEFETIKTLCKIYTNNRGIFRLWVTEIFCDLLAVRLFGPIALFSFFEVAEKSTYYLGELFDTHPPHSLRLSIMANELIEHWFSGRELNETETKIKKEIDRILTICGCDEVRRVFGRRYWDYEISIIILESLYFYLQEEVRRFEKNYFLDWEETSEVVEQLYKLIKSEVPPNQPIIMNDIQPASLQAILTVGWLAWYDFMNEDQLIENENRNNSVEEFKLINKLVLKAIESTEIQIQYNAQS